MKIAQSLINDPLLTDDGLAPNLHNSRARVLRHGLSVTAFATLEQFLMEMASQFMRDISTCQIPYSTLPEKSRKLVTVHALDGLSNRRSQKDPLDQLAFIETELPLIAQFVSTPVRYSGFGFRPRGSNVSAEDVSSFFKGLGVEKIWDKFNALTVKIGYTRADLKADFETLASSRHKSAHNPTGNIPSGDLLTNITVATLIAITFSAYLEIIRAAYLSSRSVNQLKNNLTAASFNFRSIEKRSESSWAEMSLTGNGTIKIYNTMENAVAAARGRRKQASILVRHPNFMPIAFFPI